ncbi:methyl-accepting chemotaxis protein [Halobacteriovorax sp. HLS]|uniref:methyl-accepting chemotaxis protein n=1 Tax=Halobacteriovorax sp. HLS TaxID=2234000 RepID=UPI000FD74F7E|nr:methyl-accepting chemotaxis protein [Halobacteriovorax sp. HLS]
MFSTLFIYSSYTNTSKNLMNEKKLSIQFVIQAAMAVVKDHQEKVKKGELTLEQAKKMAAASIGRIRYGQAKDDYLWINDSFPKMVEHPVKSLVGNDLNTFKDKVGDKIFVKMVDIAKASGDGFIQYTWVDKKDKSKHVPKLSYIAYDKDWDWILGTGIYIEDVKATINKALIEDITKVIIAMIIIILAISFVVKKNIRGPLLSIAEKLFKTSEYVSNGANKSLDNCNLLSAASQNQASSLQQTVSSVEEINAMIQRNSASAQASKDTSLKSQNSANKGKGSVDEMLVTIEDITKNNEKVISRMKLTNSEVSEILNIIKNINEKTKVINDIVFQTKLLSFNASVEAARAGESGKGFAVVAEEIGALANMSGSASEEIRELIDSSMNKVEQIVNSTTSVMDEMIAEGTQAVDKGKEKAYECKVILDEIIGNVDLVNNQVNEIANASKEQSQGVHEISKAMEILDQVGHENNSTVIETAESSKQLQREAQELIHVIEQVKEMVEGKSKKAS